MSAPTDYPAEVGKILGWLARRLPEIKTNSAARNAELFEQLTLLRDETTIVIADLETILLDAVADTGAKAAIVQDDTGATATVTRTSSSKKYKWDREGVFADIVARILDSRDRFDPDTGEARESEGRFVAHRLRDVYGLAKKDPLVTPVRELGIDVDTYRTQEGWSGGNRVEVKTS